jgi:hypothetical protein
MVKINSFWQPVKPNKNIKPTRLFGFEMNPKLRTNFDLKPRAPITPVSFGNSRKYIRVQPINIKLYPLKTKKEIKLIDKNPFGDRDKDKVPNIFDCRPLNRKKQDFFPYRKASDRKKIKKRGKKISGRRPTLLKKIKETEPFYPNKKSDRTKIINKPHSPDLRKRKPLMTEEELELLIDDVDKEDKNKRLRRTKEQIKDDKSLEKWGKKYEKITAQLDKELKIKKTQKKGPSPIKRPTITALPETKSSSPKKAEEDAFYKELAEKLVEQPSQPIKAPEPVSEQQQKQREYIASLLGRKNKWDKKAMALPPKKIKKKKEDLGPAKIVHIAKGDTPEDYDKRQEIKNRKEYEREAEEIRQEALEQPYDNKATDVYTAQDFIDVPKEKLKEQKEKEEKVDKEMTEEYGISEPEMDTSEKTAQELIDEA